MIVFARKDMRGEDRSRLQEQIARLQIALNAPADLMMFSSPSGKFGVETIFIGLPSRSLLAYFDGFIVVERSDLPDRLTTFVCREDGFKHRFPDIWAKRRID